jgi:hypothetical protein
MSLFPETFEFAQIEWRYSCFVTGSAKHDRKKIMNSLTNQSLFTVRRTEASSLVNKVLRTACHGT